MSGVYHLYKIPELAKQKGYSIRSLSIKAGLSDNTVRVMISRNAGEMGNLLKLASILGVHISELYQTSQNADFENPYQTGLQGSIDTIRNLAKELKSSGILRLTDNIEGWIPLINFELITRNKTIKDLIDNSPSEIKSYYMPATANASFLIFMPGRAMKPDINSGDLLVCQYMQNPNFIEYGRIYFLETDQGILIRRLQQSDTNNNIKCTSPNSAFQSFDLDKKDIISYSLVLAKYRLE